MIRFAAALICVASLAACQPAPPEAPAAPEAPESPEAPVAPAALDTLTISDDARALSEAPIAPLRIDGACPFEGCVYGTWTTSAETTVYRASGDTTSAAFTIPAQAVLEADRGFALMTRIGRAVADRPSELYLANGEARPIASGDTLLILDYQGEGFYRMWASGALGSADAYGASSGPSDGPAIRQVTEPEQQWWAHVTLSDGRSGWLWMDRTPSMGGADSLG